MRLCSLLLNASATHALHHPPVQVGANLWIDFEAGELARLERQLASMPQLAAKIVHFEGCEWMQYSWREGARPGASALLLTRLLFNVSCVWHTH